MYVVRITENEIANNIKKHVFPSKYLPSSVFIYFLFTSFKDELKLEVMREREMRESLKKELQEEHKSRVLFQKRCAKLKKLRRQLQERLDMEVAQRNKKDSEGVRSATPDTLTEVNGKLKIISHCSFNKQVNISVITAL